MNLPKGFITAEQRLAEPRGVKILLLGPSGVGKTTQLKTLKPEARANWGSALRWRWRCYRHWHY
jgi:hypothetical protein